MNSNAFSGRFLGWVIMAALIWIFFGPLITALWNLLPLLVLGVLIVVFLTACDGFTNKDDDKR